MSNPTLLIKIDGDVSRDSMPMEDLGGIMTAISNLIRHAGTEIDGFDQNDGDLFRVSASTIHDGSVEVTVSPLQPDLATQAAASVAKFLTIPLYRLPRGFKTPIKSLREYSRKYNAIISTRAIKSTNGDLFRFEPTEGVIETTIQGRTTIYGRVVRIGGVTEPKVTLRYRKQTVSCSVDEDTAKELAKYLYKMVALTGIAKREVGSDEYADFVIDSFIPVDTGDPAGSFRKMRDLVGPDFDKASTFDIMKGIRGE